MIHLMCIFSFSLSQTHTHTGIEGPELEPSLQIQGQDPPTGPEGMMGQVVDSPASGHSCAPSVCPSAFQPQLLFFHYDFYNFNLFWLCWIFVAAASLWSWQQGLPSSCGARGPHCGGFSCCGAWALGSVGPIVVLPGLQSTGSVVAMLGLSCRPRSCLDS